jgi:hypothetical protein
MDIGGILGAFMGLGILFAIIPIALAIWALVDLAGKPMDGVMKVVWAAAIIFFPFIGSIASLIINRQPRRLA